LGMQGSASLLVLLPHLPEVFLGTKRLTRTHL
jgi:hypothetical protein